MEIKIGSGVVATVHPDGSATIKFKSAVDANHVASTMAMVHLERASNLKTQAPQSASINRELHQKWWALRDALHAAQTRSQL